MGSSKKCTSCNKEIINIKGIVAFPCPSCGEEIIRCPSCRKVAVKYICKKCNFEGP